MVWNPSLHGTCVTYGAAHADAVIGSGLFQSDNAAAVQSAVKMAAAPYATPAGKTYVPAQFFQLLGCKVSVGADGLLHIEKMSGK